MPNSYCSPAPFPCFHARSGGLIAGPGLQELASCSFHTCLAGSQVCLGSLSYTSLSTSDLHGISVKQRKAYLGR